MLRTTTRVISIVDAMPVHAADVAAIYAHHVRTGTASFDSDGPPVEAWRTKIADIRARGWPFAVAAEADHVIGYAYATQFRDRPAYAHTCENSIYVHPDAVGRGVGSALMTALIERASAAGFHQMIAVIGGGEPASIALHTKAGFRHAGRMEKVGMKFGRLLDTVYMQRGLGVGHA
jgi:L-amino acid N-acyltransferase YncA